MKGSGLSPAQINNVEVIGRNQKMRMKELAERLGVTNGTLTVGVDKLEKMGLVERRPHEKDRRSWLIVLTDKGKLIYEQHHRFHQEFTREISSDLSNDEIKTLSKLLGVVLEGM